ncbi:SDR family oxidoreductase [Mycolicibacterium sp. CR10]|uniref:SDR family oxidoreductase n=1 Tax=Mycolicibacterium sp. CR10 TaxID=2562314 RepID=UPI0010C0D31D|nr:SDR family oxidoreductase [Mycolicibacterium sp. CR10]
MTDAADSALRAINLGLHGRVVLVTGGVRGVGAGISKVFADQGATVVTCARRPVEDSPYEFHACDIRDDDSVKALIDAIVADHGRLDVVVNNAGGSPYVLAAESSAKFSTKILQLNLLGALSVSTHANAVMQTQDLGGSIVNISSVSGRRPTPGTVAYGAAKAGIESITGTLAVEWAPKVRVNSVVVGMVETEQSDLFYGDADSIAAISKNVPLGRLGRPADIGWATAFLASEAASYISGASLEVHGGGEPPHYLSTTTADIKQ